MPERAAVRPGPIAWTSLILAVAGCAMWGRSYFREDRCDFEGRPDPAGRSDRIGIVSAGGSLCVVRGRSTRTEAFVLALVGVDDPPVSLTAPAPRFTWSTRPARPLPRYGSPLSHLAQFRRFREGNASTLKTPSGTVTSHHHHFAVTFPYWCAMLPAALPAAVWSAARLRCRRHRRAGFCVAALRDPACPPGQG